MTIANGPQMNRSIDELLHLAKKVEPYPTEYEAFRKGPLLPYLPLINNSTYCTFVLERLIVTLATPAQDNVRKDKILYLNYCVERVHQIYFFIHFFVSTFDLKNIQYFKLLRLVVNELTNCLYLYSALFLPDKEFLEKHPDFYVRNIHFKHLLDSARQSYTIFLAFIFENENSFPQEMVKNLKERPSLPLLTLRAETCFLRVERCVSQTTAIKDESHKIFCNGQLIRLLERKRQLPNLPESELFANLDNLKAEDVLSPELTTRLNILYKQRLLLEDLIPQVTIKNFTQPKNINDCSLLFLQLDALAEAAESYLALTEDEHNHILKDPVFYDKVFETFEALLKIQDINQGIDLCHFLFKVKIIISLWNTLFVKLDSAFCLAVHQEFEWVKSFCEKAAAFYDDYTLNQKQSFVSSGKKEVSLSALLQKLQDLSLGKTLTLDIISTTKKILHFAKGIRPNQSKFQIDCFFEEYKNIREFPMALEGVVACFLDILEEETLTLNSFSLDTADFSKHHLQIKMHLRRVNAIVFLNTYLAKPWDITHPFHQRLLYMLFSSLIESLQAYCLFYQAKTIPLNQIPEVAKTLFIYGDYLNHILLYFKHFTFYLKKYRDKFPEELISEIKRSLWSVHQKSLDIHLCLLDICLWNHQNLTQVLLAAEIAYQTLHEITQDLAEDSPHKVTSHAYLKEARTRLSSHPDILSENQLAFYLHFYKTLMQFKNEIAVLLTEPSLESHSSLEQERLQNLDEALQRLKEAPPPEAFLLLLSEHCEKAFRTKGLSKTFLVQRYLLKVASLAFAWVKILYQHEEKPFIKEVVILLTHCASFCTETLSLQKRLAPLKLPIATNVEKQAINPAMPKTVQNLKPVAPASAPDSTPTPSSRESAAPEPASKSTAVLIPNTTKKPKRKQKKCVKVKPEEINLPIALPAETADVPFYLAKASSRQDAIKPLAPLSPIKSPKVSPKPKENAVKPLPTLPHRSKAKSAPKQKRPSPPLLQKPPPARPKAINSLKIQHEKVVDSLPTVPEVKPSQKVDLPPVVQAILKKLEAKEIRAYVVGGYPRDQLCKVPWWDIDILAQGTRNDILAILQQGFPNAFYPDLIELEIEGIHIDIVCAESIEKSLPRRDLTINTLLINSEGELVDPLKALPDIDLPYLKLCPNIEQLPHFAANILRIIRFSTTLNKEILPETKAWMHQHAAKIQELPLGIFCANIERLFLRGKGVAQWHALKKCGIYPYLFPATLARNGMHHDDHILDFLQYHFELIDKTPLKERKEQYKVFHILALLLLPELMEQSLSNTIDSQIEFVLNAFCKIEPNAPYNAEMVRFQKAMHPVMKHTLHLYMQHVLHPKKETQPLLFSAGQTHLAPAANLSAMSIDPASKNENIHEKRHGL